MEYRNPVKAWVCVNKDGRFDYTSFGYTKRSSKQSFLEPFNEPNWNDWAKLGWQCIKVKLSITEL